MIIRFAFAFSLLAATSLAAQVPSPAAPAAPTAAASAPADLVRVRMDTEKGPIVLALDRGHAPLTVANFLRYVDAHRFDGIAFYRAMPYGEPGNGLIQSGITDPARLFPPVRHEPTSVTGIHHDAGAISMARTAPGTARATFFILAGPIPGFDAGTGQAGDDQGFAAFGHVVEGMAVVKAILADPVDPTRGEPAMRGQMLARPVRIIKVSRAP